MILTVLLTILKIIGIILASVLGLVLLIILLLLFVPIRYRASGYRTGAEGDPPVTAKASASWLLHIIHVSARYPSEKIVTVRIFGIPVFHLPADKKTDQPEDSKKGHQKKHKEKEDKGAEAAEKDEIPGKESAEIKTPENKTAEVTDKDDTESDEADIQSEQEADLITRVKCTITSIYVKIKSLVNDKVNRAERIKKDIHYYYVIITSDLFERTFEKVKKKLLRLLRSIMPRKFDLNILIGLEDPYTVGEIMAIAGMIYPYTYKGLHIQGTFEENIIKGAGKLHGRIYLFSFVKLVIYYLTDKDLKRLIRLFKKEEKSRGRK